MAQLAELEAMNNTFGMAPKTPGEELGDATPLAKATERENNHSIDTYAVSSDLVFGITYECRSNRAPMSDSHT